MNVIKKISAVVFASISVSILLVACEKEDDSSVTKANIKSQTSVQENITNSVDTSSQITEENIYSQGGYDVFSKNFIDEVYDIYCCNIILGDDTVEKWVNDVFLKKSDEEMNATPTLYQGVHELSIKKEQLLEYNNNLKNKDTNAVLIPDYVIEAIYLNDEKEMIKILASPSALYHDGASFSFNQIKNMSSDEMISLGITSTELKQYSKSVKEVITDEVTEKDYEKYYKDDVDKIESKIY